MLLLAFLLTDCFFLRSSEVYTGAFIVKGSKEEGVCLCAAAETRMKVHRLG